MKLSILHISDLHRDPDSQITNPALLHSLERDRDRYTKETPPIKPPDLILVSGDIIHGVKDSQSDTTNLLVQQYEEAEHFLSDLAQSFVDGDKNRVIIVPGNHDVSYYHSLKSMKERNIDRRPAGAGDVLAALFQRFTSPNTTLRWSWNSLTYSEIVDENLYLSRLAEFCNFYSHFYDSQRSYDLMPERQYDIFDLPDFGFTIAAFCSCYNNDPLNRIGAIHPDCIAHASSRLRKPMYHGRMFMAVWHHGISGAPNQYDYMDPDTVQVLIDSGFSIGFHGHQHKSEFIDEKFQFGGNRKLTVLGAGTLCGGPGALPTGQSRSYNILQINTDTYAATLHLRQMKNLDFSSPIWGPGALPFSTERFVEFTVDPPPDRIDQDSQIPVSVSEAESHFARGEYAAAVRLLAPLASRNDIARRLLLECYVKQNSNKEIITEFYPPQSTAEIIYVVDALWEQKDITRLREMLNSRVVGESTNPAIIEILHKYKGRLDT